MSSCLRRATFVLAAAVSCLTLSASPTPSGARTLPVHCADLLDGDCESPLYCLYLCFIELRDQVEFCALHPTDPRCQ